MANNLSQIYSISEIKQITSIASTQFQNEFRPGFISGRYYPTSNCVRLSNRIDIISNRLYLSYIFLPEIVIKTLTINITSMKSQPSANISLGVYDVANSGYPKNLLMTQAANITTSGIKEFNFNLGLDGGWYALAYSTDSTGLQMRTAHYAHGAEPYLYGVSTPNRGNFESGLAFNVSDDVLMPTVINESSITYTSVSPVIYVKF